MNSSGCLLSREAEFPFAHEGEIAPQGPYLALFGGAPSRRGDMAGPAAFRAQAGRAVAPVALAPAVERGARPANGLKRGGFGAAFRAQRLEEFEPR